MFDNIGRESSHAMQVRSMLKLIAGVALSLGLVIAAATTVAAPKAGAVQVGKRTLVPQQNLIDSSPTKTPTLTPTYQPISQAQSPRAPLSAQTIPGQTQVDPNTILLYHFDSSAGSNVIDATGNYTGTLFGTAAITTSGLYSGGLQLDGNRSYVRTSYLGDLSQGTIEAFVDFRSVCYTAAETFPIITAGGGFGSYQTILYLGDMTGLKFGIYANGQWNWVDSGVNPCRYLTGNSDFPFPYDPVTFHHVAATWGPRGMEIWIDGVLHGVGNDDPNADIEPYPYMCNPQMQWGTAGRPPNPDAPYTCPTPKMYPTMAAFPRGDYTGGLSPYSNFLIGCDASGACFKGRMDEVRISNIQRTFTLAVVPTPTPIPSQTPVYISGEYAVDSNTAALYHLNFQTSGTVLDQVTQQYKNLEGQAVLVPNGRFGSGLQLNGNRSDIDMGNLGNFAAGTVEAWVNFISPAGNQMIIDASNVLWTGAEYRILHLQTDPQNLDIVFTITGSDGLSHTVDSGTPASYLLGCWHHIAGTWGGRGLEIWIDGTLLGVNSGYTGAMNNQVTGWHTGCDFSGNCMAGILDEVRISRVQRTFTASAYAPIRALPQGPGSSILAPSSNATQNFLPMIQIPPKLVCAYGP